MHYLFVQTKFSFTRRTKANFKTCCFKTMLFSHWALLTYIFLFGLVVAATQDEPETKEILQLDPQTNSFIYDQMAGFSCNRHVLSCPKCCYAGSISVENYDSFLSLVIDGVHRGKVKFHLIKLKNPRNIQGVARVLLTVFKVLWRKYIFFNCAFSLF